MKNFKQAFPIFSQSRISAYLDSAATAQKPAVVIDAIASFYAAGYATVHRGLYEAGEIMTDQYEKVRQQTATWLNAQTHEIIFTKGATESINFVASAWGYEHVTSGVEIIVSALEHHANLIPWQRLCERTGAELKVIPIFDDGRLDYDAFEKMLNHRVKLVAVTHASNAIGTHVDVEKIIQRAHANGSRVLVDACQTAPHQKLDVKKLDCDFLVFSAHKMGGPTGLGVLYASERVHKEMPPYQFGGSMVYEVDYQHAKWKKPPWCYEAGTPPIAQVIGFGATLDWLAQHIDFDVLQKKEAALCTQAIDGLQHIPGVKVLGPVDELKRYGHLVSFVVDGMHAHDVSAYLDSQGIAVRAGHHCAQPLAKRLGYESSVRVSFWCYNTADDVEKFLHAMKSLPKL